MRFETLVVLNVVGRPASYSTASTTPWKTAVRDAVGKTGLGPWEAARFSVVIEFRTPKARNANDVWDLDNLIKPTLDAMEGVFGRRPWRGPPQTADDRVDHLEASKRPVRTDEAPGARIEVRRVSQ
ncbi:RusA family crossover junction endodeoxyribonuclease [Actinoplanes sp. DH11]|uniref:RusA family crossover junction endodeoxyribonuclease n=1 Tax=Actinoplanes sp. DH11 TaxID=2857011 RepID=UPI001E31136C|nr:RusA family crossover junction endodeoxyribonuclease [Actinoplanes sp. DH11]